MKRKRRPPTNMEASGRQGGPGGGRETKWQQIGVVAATLLHETRKRRDGR